MNLLPKEVNWSKFIDADFWLEGIAGKNLIASPLELDGFRNLFLTVTVFVIVSGMFLRLYKVFLPQQHPLQSKIGLWTTNLVWIGFLGFCWWLANQWQAFFIGAKVWILVGAAWLLVLAYLVTRYFLTDFSLEYNYYKKKYLSVQAESDKNSTKDKK